MVRKIVNTVSFLIFTFGLPVLGWWLSTLILYKPPIVAPFLFASPFYAMLVWGFIVSRTSRRDFEDNRSPLDAHQIEPVIGHHEDLFDKYLGKVAFVSGESLSDGVTIWKGWIFIDPELWWKLSREAREFMLVRAARCSKRKWWSTPLTYLVFLAAYLLACFNLWFVILLHVGGAAALATYLSHKIGTYATDRDRAALAIARNYDGARQYLTTIKLDSDHRKSRLAALKQSALALGLS